MIFMNFRLRSATSYYQSTNCLMNFVIYCPEINIFDEELYIDKHNSNKTAGLEVFH